jgi:ATP-dependent DNA helicase DinG
MAMLIWPDPVVLVVSRWLQQRLMMVELPRLRQWIPTLKSIHVGDRWPDPAFQGILITTPEAWLDNCFASQRSIPPGVATIVDGADDLETWVRDYFTVHITPKDWEALMWACPSYQDKIRDVRVRLTHDAFQHPANPYNCYLLGEDEQERINGLHADFLSNPGAMMQLPPVWQRFWQQFNSDDSMVWVAIARELGQFSLCCSPIEVAPLLKTIWAQQPVVFIGGTLDVDGDAANYRQRLGLADDLTCVKFSPDRQTECIQLYLPDGLPMPNTPQFQPALLQQLRSLLTLRGDDQGLTVVLLGDMPLKHQVGSILAAEFGSRVQVERTCLDDNGILVTGWEFWHTHQSVFPSPELLVIATLPLPSLENPLVAGRVTHYKRQRQDWFRLYLLPEALMELQRAIAPVREAQGVVALLDNRVNHRSYGQQVLNAMSPMARVNYVDARLFKSMNSLA